MKYIAVFDIPDDYAIGCANAKIAPKKTKEVLSDYDFKNAYAQPEPLSEKGAENFERFNTVDRIMSDLGLHCAYDMPGFWCNNRKDYKVIETQFHKGYMQALQDIEREVRLRFGFSEKDCVASAPITLMAGKEET